VGLDFVSRANNEFSARAHGGVRFETAGAGLHVDGQAVALRAGGNAFSGNQTVTNGIVGVGNNTPIHALHVGSTLQTPTINVSEQRLAIESAQPNGRAVFLALAGSGGASASNRVEVQIEASDTEH